MLIDIFTHLMPPGFLDDLAQRAPDAGGISKRLRATKPLYDLDARFRQMDVIDDYCQVVSLPNPPLDDFPPDVAQDLARIGNDGLAKIVSDHPERFPAFVAAVSMADPEAAAREAERAISELGAAGVQIYTHAAGHPLDEPRFRPFFETIHRLDRPIWLHPARTAELADYASETRSRFETWWAFGWPYDTSVALTRLVFSGLFDACPGLQVVTHHMGGMIPYYEGRIDAGLALLGSRTTDEDYSGVLSLLKRPHIDYFRDFFADTAMFGGRSGLLAGLDFFGPERVVFATDAPLAPIKATIDVLKTLDIPQDALAQITSGNARRLLRLD